MEIELTEYFRNELQQCPLYFQFEFRKMYQQLKVVNRPVEIKRVTKISKYLFTIRIMNSRIAVRQEGRKVVIGSFLFNEFYKSE